MVECVETRLVHPGTTMLRENAVRTLCFAVAVETKIASRRWSRALNAACHQTKEVHNKLDISAFPEADCARKPSCRRENRAMLL